MRTNIVHTNTTGGKKMRIKLKTRIVKEQLLRRGRSQNWLALHMKTSKGYLSQLMKGSRSLSPEMAKRMLRVLKDCKFDDILKIV